MPIKTVTSKAGKIENKEKMAEAAYQRSIEALKKIIKTLEEGELDQETLNNLNYYFILGDNPQKQIPGEILAHLKNTLKGLTEIPFTVEITFFNFANPGKGDKFSIANAQFKSANQCIRYMIHEASHAFSGTQDFSERGYTDNLGKFRQPGLTREEAVNNADGLAVFTVLHSQIALV
ncbi:hypothetical protein [Bowmanella denitrificans]|uniref:hypothetical protein n=1 Tax=Bowmanella denitrificans TaxID=366582 RepID=UPI000C9A5429|nr:hypothetical protein [Bowmanella denitrificans]